MKMVRKVKARSHDARSDDGFTLIELLIVVVIMPIIVGAIAYGLVAVFSLQNSVSQRLSGSTDLQKVSAQFVKDVQSSETVLLGSTPQQCGSTGIQLLGLTWNNANTMVSYVQVPMQNNTTNFMLQRLYCTLGNMNTPVSTSILSSDYVTKASLTQYPPSVCQNSLSTCVTTSGSYNAHLLAAVTLTLYVPMASSPYTLVASPHGGAAGIGSNGSYTLTSPLTLLGSDCPNGVLSVGNGSLNINVAVTGGGTVPGTLGVANCPASAVQLANKGAINASGVLTGVTDLSGITIGANPGTYPSQVNYDSGLCNPFQNAPTNPNCPTLPASNVLTAPTYSTKCGGQGQVACVQCTQSGSSYTCPAGVYGVSPTFPNGSTITFNGSASTVTVLPTDFTIPNGSNATFYPGIYVFAAPDGGAFSTGTSNVRNKGISIVGSNVLFYTPSGGMTFSNNTYVKLTAMTPYDCLSGTSPCPPGSLLPYFDDVSIWLDGPPTTGAVSGDGVLTLGNNSTSSTNINNYGGIYVPYGQVVDSNNGTITTTFIIAGSATFSNGLNVTITAP